MRLRIDTTVEQPTPFECGVVKVKTEQLETSDNLVSLLKNYSTDLELVV